MARPIISLKSGQQVSMQQQQIYISIQHGSNFNIITHGSNMKMKRNKKSLGSLLGKVAINTIGIIFG